MLRAFDIKRNTIKRNTCSACCLDRHEKRMSKNQAAERPATSEDVAKIFGNLDPAVMLSIMGLRPTIADLEEASMWLGGDRDVFEPAPPLKGVASKIVTILAADEEEEPPHSG